MATDKVKIYRNPERNKPQNMRIHTPFYQQEQIEPQIYTSPTSPAYNVGVAKRVPTDLNNPRASRPVIRQTYGEQVPSPVGAGRGSLPNVGNNVEQSWASVDGQIVDDISEIDSETQMIDNNEYVSSESLGLPSEGLVESVEDSINDDSSFGHSEKMLLTEDDVQGALREEYLGVVLQQLEEDEYLLLVTGECIASGPASEIQEQARAMVFGEHPLCDGNPIPIDDIVVIKRIPIKVGLFLS